MKRDMLRKLEPVIAFTLAAMLALSATSCSRFSSQTRHMKRADSYFEAGAYPEAEIEYRNVLQSGSPNLRAIARLGLIYYDQGSTIKAIPYLIKGNELQPNTPELEAIQAEVQIRLAQVSFARGDAKNARDQAISILGRIPNNPKAPLLLAEASVKPKDIDDAIQRLKQLSVSAKDIAPALIALGTLDFKIHDSAAADESLKKALAADPKSSAANYGLGALYMQEQNKVRADQFLDAAYKLAPHHSPIAVMVARYKMQSGDVDGARRILEEIVRNTPDFVTAAMFLAEVDLSQKKYPEAVALIEKLLAHDPSNPDALLLNTKANLAQGKAKAAIDGLVRMTGMYPKFAAIYYLLGQAYLQAGDVGKAADSLTRAIALNPNFTEAVLLLAKTNISKGDFKAASDRLSQMLKKHPDFVPGQLLLAQALRGQGDFDHALQAYRSLEKSRPKDPEMPLFTGMMFRQLNRRDEARVCFNRSLEILPTYLPAVEQLINLDLVEKKFDAARDRANAEIERSPKSELPRLFLAKVYLAQGDKERSEAALLKTVELKPDAPTAYFLLAQLYAATNRRDKALEDLKEVAAKDPKAVGAMMMMGEIYESQKNYTAAKETYERILAVNPNFSSALNNLACLCADKLGQQDKGFEYAQRARELQPNEPHIADTLGWIHYERHEYTWALGLLEESAGKLPNEPDVQFHVGMIHYMMGEEAKAMAAFQRALQLPGAFEGREEASRRLALLKISPPAVSPADRPNVEKSLSEQKSDPVALVRLAGLYERDGSLDKAIESLQAALQLNPASVTTMVDLAGLYNKQHDTQHAMDMAKAAHKAAPDDPGVSHSLSTLAYQTHDYQWAYSLLKEAIGSMSEDSIALYDFANAALSVGRLQEAQDAMSSAVTLGLPVPQKDAAQRFLDMMALANSPAKAVAEMSRVNYVLNLDPGYAPALMARAGAEEANGTPTEAENDYEKLLAEFPDFSPAKRRLAILYSQDPSKDQRTSDLAARAQEAFPGDPDLGRVRGIVAYRNKNFAMAVSVLQEIALRRSDDAVLQFYLGMSQMGLKNLPACRSALQHALDLGLDSDLSTQARKALAATK